MFKAIRTMLLAALVLLILPVTLVAQAVADTAVVVMPAIPGSIAQFLTQYQLAIVPLLTSGFLYLLAHNTGFGDLSNWAKVGIQSLAALIVFVLLRLIGGVASPDLWAMIVSALFPAAVTVAGSGLTYQMGRNQPGSSR